MIELYQAEWCPYSRRVRQRLTELGVSPALIDDGEVVIGDADALIAYLDRTYSERADAEEHRRQAELHESRGVGGCLLTLRPRDGSSPARGARRGRPSRRRRCGAGSVVAMKSASTSARPSGSSRWGKWAARGSVSKRLPGIASWAARPCASGIVRSRSPQTISVGMSPQQVEAVAGADALAVRVDHRAQRLQERARARPRSSSGRSARATACR